MAYFSSWGKRSYSRRGYSGYNWKRRRLTPTRAFKRSASNMTQNGLFNVNCVVPVVLNPASMLTGGQSSGYMGAFSVLDVPGTIYTSAMHAALKKVFDQYRIEKVTVKIGMGANSGAIPIGTMFSCIDRTGFDETAQMDLATIRSYGSYKEKQTSGDGSAVSPLIMNIAQTDVVGLSLYRDTYSNVTFPKVLVGWHAYTNSQLNAVQLQIEIDAAVRYRGVRLSNKFDVPTENWTYIKRGVASDGSDEAYWDDFIYTATSKSVSLQSGDMLVTFLKKPRKIFNKVFGNYAFYQAASATSATLVADSYYTVLSSAGATAPNLLQFFNEDEEVISSIEEPANSTGQYLLMSLYPAELVVPAVDPYVDQLIG